MLKTGWRPGSCLALAVLMPVLHGQQVRRSSAPEVTPLPPISMPLDRADDSYAIYSQLMPGDEFSNPLWPHRLWLIGETTVAAVPPDQPCQPAEADFMNPHYAIAAPAERESQFAEVLEDFDAHCHDRVSLTPDGFKLPVPFRLLDDETQRLLEGSGSMLKSSAEPGFAFAGAPGLNLFSEVYFDAHHTLAMVQTFEWCGSTCGELYWVVLEHKDGVWKTLPWVRTHAFA